MPLFIIVSGYFSKKQANKSGGNKRLLGIFLLFQTMYTLLNAITSNVSVGGVLTPVFALWYILSLVYWRMMLQIMPNRLIDKPILVMMLSFIFSVLVGFSSIGNILAFHGTFLFFPFFMIGFYIRKYDCIESIRSQSKLISGFILFALLIVCYLWIPPFYAGSRYADATMWQDCGMRIIQLLIATIVCFCFLIITPEKIGRITEIGQNTLIIYLLHPPIVKILKVISTKLGYNPDILIALLITVITVTFLYSIRKIKIFKYLT